MGRKILAIPTHIYTTPSPDKMHAKAGALFRYEYVLTTICLISELGRSRLEFERHKALHPVQFCFSDDSCSSAEVLSTV